MTKDMTKGSPWRLIFFFTVPVLLGNIFQQLYSMVDTIIVGRFVSVQALAAVGATGSISFLVIGFATGITSGFGIVIAQKFGAGDEKAVRPFSWCIDCFMHYYYHNSDNIKFDNVKICFGINEYAG